MNKPILQISGLLVAAFLSVFLSSAYGQSSCDCVRSYVNPKVPFPKGGCRQQQTYGSEKETIRAIACLLQEKGNQTPSRFWSAVISTKMSDNLPPPSVEVAALYEINRLFVRDEDFAWAMVIEHVGDKESNSPEVLEIAFDEFEMWFRIVKRIGLAEARSLGLGPLRHSEVRWYNRS